MLNALVFFYGGETGTGAEISQFMIRLSSITDATYAPYSNICPITGWTGANVTRTGKNLMNQNDVTLPSENTWASNVVFPAPLPAGNYVLSVIASVSGGMTFGIRDADNNSVASVQFSVTAGVRAIVPVTTSGVGTKYSGYYNKAGTLTEFQLEVGSTATTYEPYTGQTIPVNWQTEAGTVYGGSLNVTTGVLTITDGYIASYAGETLPSTWISDRDVYAEGTIPTTGAEVVYTLETATTVSLTPQEVSVLAGDNNIFCDTGDISVTYHADTKLYIDKKIAEALA